VTLGDLIEAPLHGRENRQPFLQRALGAAMDQIAGGGQGKIAFDRACPSVTQKRPLVSRFRTARWVALGHENESTSLRESSKRHWKNESGCWRAARAPPG
jgi:hypothetical protein